jgi:hypothetical protein
MSEPAKIKIKATIKFPRPISKENEYKYKVPDRDVALVEKYQQELRDAIDDMKEYAPYRSMVQSARASIRRNKEWLHGIIGFKSPELPTWFGKIRYELDEPNASMARAIIDMALTELNLTEEAQQKYQEVEEELQKKQMAEVDTKAFLGQMWILEKKEEIYLEHRVDFTEKLAACAENVDEKYVSLFNTQKGVSIAWDMYVITQFNTMSQHYNKLYNRMKTIFIKLATDLKTQTRVFSHDSLNLRWLPVRRFVKQLGYNQSVMSTLKELDTNQLDYTSKFQMLLLKITREQKTDINDRQMRFYLDDTEYT